MRRTSRAFPTPKRSLFGAILGVLLASSATARAEEPTTDYCKKVIARAQADASLLFAPTVSAQVIKYPPTGVADTTGLQVGTGVQPRAAMSVGLVDMYRGSLVLDVAHADCRRELVAEDLRIVVALKADLGRLPALTRQLEYLRRRRPEIAAMVTRAEERRAAKITTLVEVIEIRRKALEMDRKIAQLEGEVALVAARRPPALGKPLVAALEEYEKLAMEYERSGTRLRSVQPWRLNVSGGVVAAPVFGYFGVVELAYNFGGIFQSAAETRALDARAQELQGSRSELRAQVKQLVDELRASVVAMRGEGAAIDAHLAQLAREQASIADVDAPNKDQVATALALEIIELEAERTYLTVLIEQRSVIGDRHGTK